MIDLQFIYANANLITYLKIMIIQMQSKMTGSNGDWVVAHKKQGMYHNLPNPLISLIKPSGIFIFSESSKLGKFIV
jgi:hypothetical protein